MRMLQIILIGATWWLHNSFNLIFNAWISGTAINIKLHEPMQQAHWFM